MDPNGKEKDRNNNNQDRKGAFPQTNTVGCRQQNWFTNYQVKKPHTDPRVYKEKGRPAKVENEFNEVKEDRKDAADVYEEERCFKKFPACVKDWLRMDRPIITDDTWADDPEIQTLSFYIPGKSAEELKDFLLLVKANLQDKKENENKALRGLPMTSQQSSPYSPDSYLRIVFHSTENSASLLIVKNDDYVGALKTRGRWFQFEQMSGCPGRIPDIPGAVIMPFLESYPSITKAANLKHEMLEFNKSCLEEAVNSLLSSVKTTKFARGVLVLINIACEAVRNSQILRDLVCSFKVPRNFGSANTARVHSWANMSRIFYYCVSEGVMKKAVEAIYSKLDIEYFIAKAMAEVGILKRPTEFQQSAQGVEQCLSDFKREAETPKSNLRKVLFSD